MFIDLGPGCFRECYRDQELNGAKRNIETLATYEIYKRRKISSLTTIVRSFEDFFTYSMKIRTEGLKEDHGEEPWSLAGK